jgi:hypothetical protein
MESPQVVGERLLEGIRERDRAAISACFAPDASFRVLTPHRLREHDGRDEVAARYAYWLDPLEHFEVEDADATLVADRLRVRYRFRGRDPQHGWQLNEHTAYAEVEAGQIVAATVTCSGFRPAEASR